MSGFDLIDAESGIFVSSNRGGGTVMLGPGNVIAAAMTPEAPETGDEDTQRRVEIGDRALTAELSPTLTAFSVEGELTGAADVGLQAAAAHLRGPAAETAFDCLALTTRTVREPAAGLALRRSILVALADGGVLAVEAARPDQAGGHDSEETVAVLAGPAGAQRAGEVLLSTTYDGGGRQSRATLEIWPEAESGQRLVRAGGSIIAGATLEAEGRHLEIGFFRWSVDGRPGLGRYEIASAG